jgi:hypothetical protein
MISLTTAKTLLFVALALNPGSHCIFVTSNSENYSFTEEAGRGWHLATKGLPTSNWQPQGLLENVPPSGHDATVIDRYPWGQSSNLQLSDGNRIEKQGTAGFYIVSPGAPNEKDFTILYPPAP